MSHGVGQDVLVEGLHEDHVKRDPVLVLSVTLYLFDERHLLSFFLQAEPVEKAVCLFH